MVVLALHRLSLAQLQSMVAVVAVVTLTMAALKAQAVLVGVVTAAAHLPLVELPT
jgi:hypothetical protein